MDNTHSFPVDPTDLFGRLEATWASTDDVEEEVLARMGLSDNIVDRFRAGELPTGGLVDIDQIVDHASGVSTRRHLTVFSTHPHITQRRNETMGYSKQYEESAQQAAAIVGKYEPTDPDYRLVATADQLAEKFAKVHDPAGFWGPEDKLHEWCQAVHDMAKKASPARIDRVTIDTTNGWSMVPGCTQVIFVRIHPSSPNYVKGEREAMALVYATPDTARTYNGKVFSQDFEDLIFGAAEFYPSTSRAFEAAKELRQAIRTLVDTNKGDDFEPDTELDTTPAKAPRWGV